MCVRVCACVCVCVVCCVLCVSVSQVGAGGRPAYGARLHWRRRFVDLPRDGGHAHVR